MKKIIDSRQLPLNLGFSTQETSSFSKTIAIEASSAKVIQLTDRIASSQTMPTNIGANTEKQLSEIYSEILRSVSHIE
jgi:hypothetical protein